MSKSEQQLQREVVRLERAIEFMQREHQKILSGLHQEIAQLTQKCSGFISIHASLSSKEIISDLQFTLAMQGEAAKNAEQMKQTVAQLQEEVSLIEKNFKAVSNIGFIAGVCVPESNIFDGSAFI